MLDSVAFGSSTEFVGLLRRAVVFSLAARRWRRADRALLVGLAAEYVRRALLAPIQHDQALYFPPDGGPWDGVEPASVGWDRQALDAALELAGRRRSTGVVLLQGGRILAEQYWEGATPQSSRDIASAQKSVTAVLIGIAQREGLLSIDDPVNQWLGRGWSRAPHAQESEILLRHLLTMTSGLDGRLRFQTPPGTTWYYNTPAYQMLHSVLEAATGSPLQAYSEEVLFGPTGMTSPVWTVRPDDTEELALVITPRDMARFGLLVLAGGWWREDPVLDDPDYLNAALSASQTFNPSYGMLWWLNGAPTHELPGDDPHPIAGPIIRSAPDDPVAALGTNDQKIYVVPSLDLIVVRQGGPTGPPDLTVTSFDNAWWKALMAAAPGRETRLERRSARGSGSVVGRRRAR